MKQFIIFLTMVVGATSFVGCAGSTSAFYERHEVDEGQPLPVKMTDNTASDTSALALKEIDSAVPWQLSDGYSALYAIPKSGSGDTRTYPYGTGKRDTLWVPDHTLASVTEVLPFIGLAVSPKYPPNLCNIDTVRVMAMDLVDSSGTVLKTVIAKSSDTLFNRAVLHAAMQWHFRWPRSFRSAVPVWLSIPFIILPRPHAREWKPYN